MKKIIFAVVAMASGFAYAAPPHLKKVSGEVVVAQEGVLNCLTICEQTRGGKINRECIRACGEVNACFAAKGCEGELCVRQYQECER